MCAATILTNRVLVSAAHCFNERYRDSDWFVRVGDNFMASRDPSEQTFQVSDVGRIVAARPHQMVGWIWNATFLVGPTVSVQSPNGCLSLSLQVSLIVRHEKFVPLSSPGGDGRNDIALLYIRTRGGRGISFDKFVTPVCLPAPDNKIKR